MKDKVLIFGKDPCSVRLDDPTIQTMLDAKVREPKSCRYYIEPQGCCSPERYGCVQMAGVKVARYVIQFYSEATEQTLALEMEEFRQRAPMPTKDVEAYIDTPDNDYRHINDPEVVVQRVEEYARKVLDLKLGERVFRSPEEQLTSKNDCP